MYKTTLHHHKKVGWKAIAIKTKTAHSVSLKHNFTTNMASYSSFPMATHSRVTAIKHYGSQYKIIENTRRRGEVLSTPGEVAV